jgi:hypothetical protein
MKFVCKGIGKIVNYVFRLASLAESSLQDGGKIIEGG